MSRNAHLASDQTRDGKRFPSYGALPPEKCFDAGVGVGIVMRDDRRLPPLKPPLGKSSPELFMQ
jgi:hypothetical protein